MRGYEFTFLLDPFLEAFCVVILRDELFVVDWIPGLVNLEVIFPHPLVVTLRLEQPVDAHPRNTKLQYTLMKKVF